ncbi:hypothetical protein L1887_43296 [Cichorium endivia]|nr:hypothetical protein L1887_43296 [Cichorium endivia]
MAPHKRSNSASSNPATPTKKLKAPHQSALTSFFTSPSTASKPKLAAEPTSPISETARGKQPISETARGKQRAQVGDVDLAATSQEEKDAQFAAELAAQDAGVSAEDYRARMRADEDMARRLHLEWSGHPAPSDGAAAGASKFEPASHAMDASAPPSPSKKPPPAAKQIDLAALDAAIEAIPLGDDIFVYDPSAVDTSAWPHVAGKHGELVPTTPYALLTHAFVLISATRSRLAITTLLTNLLRTVRAHDPDSLLPTVYLVSNHIAPPYDGVELGLGGSIVNKAIKSVTGKSARFLKQVWDKTGDPGDVAYEAKKDVKALVRPAPITVQRLFQNLHSIARLSGTGSANQKLGVVTKLLVASRGEETRFLVRTFISHLRIQAVRTTIATALARTFALVEHSTTLTPPSNDKERERANMLLVHPSERNGILANATKPKERQDPQRLVLMERLARAEKLVREQLEAEAAAEREKVTSFIMDAEVVAMDLDGRLLPFQTLANRSRKDVNLHEIKVKVGVFAFDPHVPRRRFAAQVVIPHAASAAAHALPAAVAAKPADRAVRTRALVRKHRCRPSSPLLRAGAGVQVRGHHVEEEKAEEDEEDDDDDGENDSAPPSARLHKLADVVDDDLAMDNEDEAVATLEAGRGASHVAGEAGKGVNGRGKALLSTYEPDKRCESWLKVKKDYVDGLGDSLDVVPIGAWHGMGRKATWWSPMLLALYEPGTGTSGGDRARCGRSAVRMWTVSPNYTAAIGLVNEERGLSIRFPRFMRRREDKTVEQASTPAMLAKMYFEQQKAAPAPDAREDDDDDEAPRKLAVDDGFEF